MCVCPYCTTRDDCTTLCVHVDLLLCGHKCTHHWVGVVVKGEACVCMFVQVSIHSIMVSFADQFKLVPSLPDLWPVEGP